MNDDGVIDVIDRDEWLAIAATLNGVVNGGDFIAWSISKFTANLLWSDGNFNADAVVDGQDFIAWNSNCYQAADGVSAVPEPGMGVFLIVAMASLAITRMHKHASIIHVQPHGFFKNP